MDVITGELREWAKNQDGGTSMTKWQIDVLLTIADRIDAEHGKAKVDAYLMGVAGSDEWHKVFAFFAMTEHNRFMEFLKKFEQEKGVADGNY